MGTDLRYQPKCYYATPAYADSFWGKLIYLYQGKGGLRLTPDSIRLEDCPGAVEIPFSAIKAISTGRFSTWAKPFGLSRLTVSYTTPDGELASLHLVPYESAFAPTWTTSALVSSWHETFDRVPALSGRVAPAGPAPAAPRASVTGLLVTTCVVASLGFAVLVAWFVNAR